MTEDQARETLCPMAATFGASQQLADGPGPLCVASLCMAWRWDGYVNGDGVFMRREGKHSWRGDQDNNVSHGYCGLAGSVQ